MGYTPTTWATGDTITSTKLNKMEQGIANSVMIVNTNGHNTNGAGGFDIGETLDATFAQIYEALAAGIPVYIRRKIETNGPATDYDCCASLFSVLSAHKYSDLYRVCATGVCFWSDSSRSYLGQSAIATFVASSPSAYPVATSNVRAASALDDWHY